MRLRSLTLCVVGHLLCSTMAFASSVRAVAVQLERPVVELYGRCELTVRLEGGPIKNPYDPEEVSLTATFQPPRGRAVTVDGFYYQPFERVQEGGHEALRSVGEAVWKIRFTPRAVGRWSVTVGLRTPQGTQSSPGGAFEVIRSSRQGFVQVDQKTESLRFEQGRTLIPIGENLAWGPSVQPLSTYDRWFNTLTKQGANYIRVWMAPWSLRLETKETGLGRYDQQRAWELDYLFDQSERLGLYWQLSLLDHGSFSRTQDPDWHHNPYNEQLGGLCRLPNDFVTDPHARRFFQRLLRYVVSRWGYSPQLASWELFNEADLSEIQAKDLLPWLAETGAFLRTTDVNRHPITISFHDRGPDAVWKLPMIDLVQVHLYNARDFATLFCGSTIDSLREAFHKPVMVGEFGWIEKFVREVDRYGIHFHDGLWSSLMGGAVGGALAWYWDSYIEPNGLEYHFQPLERFWRNEQIDERLRHVSLSLSDSGLSGCGIGTSQRVFLWVKNRSHNVDAYLAYRCELAKQRIRVGRGQPAQAASYPAQVVRGATLSVHGLGWWGGRYRVEWWDPYRGRVLTRAVSELHDGTLTIQIPDLAFDVAAKLVRLNWWERG